MRTNIDLLDMNNQIQHILLDRRRKEDEEISILQICMETTECEILKKKLLLEYESMTTEPMSSDNSFYISETLELIREYKQYMNQPTTVSFMGRESSSTRESELNISDMEQKFIRIASKYVDVNDITSTAVLNDTTPLLLCDHCGHDNFTSTDQGLYICDECSSEKQHDNSSITSNAFADTTRINVATKFVYDRKSHFRECLLNFQGKQHTTIPPEIITNITEKLINYKLCDDDQPATTRFNRVTKKNITNILKELNLGKHYDNAGLIHNMITNHPLPDITHLSSKILYDFDILSNTYDIYFSGITRKNFISTNYVLYQILTNNNYKCNLDDFTILKTNDRKLFHEHILKTLFEKLKWNYTSIF